MTCGIAELAAEVEGRTWDPSQTPLPTDSAPSAGLRKPRAGIQRGASPASGRSASPSTPQEAANPFGGKAVVDTQFFSGLGQANAARPDNLRPSEGGKSVRLLLLVLYAHRFHSDWQILRFRLARFFQPIINHIFSRRSITRRFPF